MMDTIQISKTVVMKSEPGSPLDVTDSGLSQQTTSVTDFPGNVLRTSSICNGGPSQVAPRIFVKTEPQQTCLEESTAKRRKIISITPVYKTDLPPSFMESARLTPPLESHATLLGTSQIVIKEEPKDESQDTVVEQTKNLVKELRLKHAGESIESKDFSCLKLDEFATENRPSTSSSSVNPVKPAEVKPNKRSKQERKKQSRLPSILRRKNQPETPPKPTTSRELMTADVKSFIDKFVPKKLRERVCGSDQAAVSDLIRKFKRGSKRKVEEDKFKPAAILRSSNAEDAHRYKYACHICRLRFRTLSLYEGHLELCKKNAPEKDPLELKLINRNLPKREMVKCVTCNRVWDAFDLASVLAHKATCPPTVNYDSSSSELTCPLCEQRFDGVPVLLAHCRVGHGLEKISFMDVNKTVKVKKRE